MEKKERFAVVELEKDKVRFIAVDDKYMYACNTQNGSTAIGSQYYPYQITRAGSVAF